MASNDIETRIPCVLRMGSVNNTNDDTAGITVETTDATSSEAGDTASFSVVLNAHPAGEVSVDIKGLVPTEGTLLTSSVTFNSDNWNVPQIVTVTGVDDSVDDNNQTYVLNFDASNSSDADFATLTAANLSALGHQVEITNEDDDIAGITLSATSGLTSEDETQTSFTVKLDSQPTEDVELILTSSNEFEGISTSSVIFNPNNWNTPQTVTVTGMNDTVEDGSQDYTITLTPRTADAKYQAVTPVTFDVTNLDNDVTPTAGVTVSGNPSENGGLATFTITLANPALPGKGRIYYSLSGTATNGEDYGQILDSVEIAAGETQATVTLQVIDDRIADDAETVTLTVLSVNEDGEYIPSPTEGSATITIADNGDTAGVVITPTQGTTNEAGGQARFEVMLTSQPTANVTLDLTTSDSGEGNLSVSSLVFTPENWDTPQSVTVTGVDDEHADGEQFYTVQATATSDDDNYAGIAINPVNLTNLDNENVAVLITPSEGEVGVSEAGVTDTYEIALTQPPSGTVEITAYADTQTEISLDGVNFADTQTVTLDGTTFQKTVYVRAIDDNDIEGPGTGTVVHRITNSSDTQYPTDLPIPSLSVAIEDNDLPTVEIISTEPGTEESTIPGQFNLRLSQPAPKGGITVYYEIGSDSTAKASNAGSFAIGEPDYFALPGQVFIPEGETGATISVVPTPNDAASEPEETVNITLLSGDGYELGSQAADSVSIFDDDIPGVRLNESGNWTRGMEGSGDIYTVSLTSQPRETVTVNFSNDGQIGAIAPLTFTPDNWKIPQTVSVQFADDEVANGDRTTTISHNITSADTDYDGMTVRDVEATILDNEVPGITVTVNETALAEGETAVASYSIVLDTQPSQDVTVSFIPDGSLEAIAPLTFTAANWNVAQDVLITPVDNDRVTGTRRSTILHRVSSADAGYNRQAIDNITVSISDNDEIGITVTPSNDSNRVREGGYTDTYEIVLNSQPSGEVTIEFFSDSDLEAISAVIFSPANWNTPQTVTITAADNGLDQDTIRSTEIRATVSSVDSLYNGYDLAADEVELGDAPEITVEKALLQLGKDGRSDNYTIVLNRQPFGDVTIEFAVDETLLQPIPAITFTRDNWNVPQTLAVSPVAELALTEAVLETAISQTVIADDVGYDNFTLADISIEILDDGTFRTWAELVADLPNQDVTLPDADALLSTLETQIGDLLLPVTLETVETDSLLLTWAYPGTVDTATLLAANPTLEAIASELGLKELLPSLPNPQVKIKHFDSSQPSIEPVLPDVSVDDLMTLLNNVDVGEVLAPVLADATGLDLQLSSDRLQIGYRDDVQLKTLLQQIPGVGEFLAQLEENGIFPDLTVSQPSLSAINVGSDSPHYEFEAKLALASVSNWLTANVTALMGDDLRSQVETLLATDALNLDVLFASDRLQVTLDDTLDLANLMNQLAAEIGLEAPFNSSTTFPVVRPSFTLSDPSTDPSFELTASRLPLAEMQTWAETQIQSAIADKTIADEASNLPITRPKPLNSIYGDVGRTRIYSPSNFFLIGYILFNNFKGSASNS